MASKISFSFPRIFRIFLSSTAVVALTVVAVAAPQKKAPSGTFSQDKGKFTIQLDGQTVGHEEFEIAPSNSGWTARGSSELKPPQASSIKVQGTLLLQPDGTPVAYDWGSQADKKNGAHIQFAAGVANITLQMEGANRPFQQDLSFSSPLIAILDNNLYYQYQVLAQIYDWSKRGQQTFPVLIPQELTPGSVTVEATGTQSAAGKSYEGLRVTTSDIEVLLVLDSNHRLMRLEVPSAKVSVIRE